MSGLRQRFLKHMAPTSNLPLGLEIVKGDGVYLYDVSGKRYLDLIAGIGVSVLGHGHPKVVGAVKKQAERYMHTMVYGEYVLSPQVELATLLANNLPEQLDSTYFVNSGSEATEGALKLAKRVTGRHEIISCRKAYHGSTHGAASLMNPTTFTQAYYPMLPGIRHIEFNCTTCLGKINRSTAAVIVETVQAESGIYPPVDGYLRALRDKCKEVGAMLIFDEIQAGYGRTGCLWAFEHYGVVPDILLLAKGMGGGMPIGAFISSREYMHHLSENPILGHITTFGGHPVSCAAGLATLQTLLSGSLISQVKRKEALFKSLLKHKNILEVRTAGLWLAVDLGSFDKVNQVIKECIKGGLIIDWFLFNSNSLRIAPPLIITEAEIEWSCSVILNALDSLKTEQD